MASRPLTPRRPWEDRRVVLGVAGGIAAYKSVELARNLTRLGAQVDVVLTSSAKEFVTPLSFEAVTGRAAHQSLFSAGDSALHIRLAREADVVCVAPATANLLAEAAHGFAGDLLTTLLLATEAPVVLCPAMNHHMFRHVQTQANLEVLARRPGYLVAGPATGAMAYGEEEGPGRMLEPEEIVEHLGRALAAGPPWSGLPVLVTAGPTREPLDPVRFVGNRSSGRMGYAIAQAAWRRGAAVTLISGPTALDAPVGVERVVVETAREMQAAVAKALPGSRVVIMAAAVADFRPAATEASKIKRNGAPFEIVLEANPDILVETRRSRTPGAVVVGFALETGDLVTNAGAKLKDKALDLIVANDPREEGSGFEVETNRVTLLDQEGNTEELPLLSKAEVAERLLDRIEPMIGATGAASRTKGGRPRSRSR
ncbi:MAG: bifunctional phosphopantothenoylcysteine decarboxylase/phosphopantothenate--cysteine ligase CoaBC [Gemmatimonadetes bacterium]|nr:bifunctional phosphopantothenoylcysteine decarboxylase/phosphopantothenate--cysteine ligase CoaBC [Gemmatimonadota bacterium]